MPPGLSSEEAEWPASEEAAGERAEELIRELVQGCLPSEQTVHSLLRRACETFDDLPTLVPVQVPTGARMHVVGDIHGQFPELLRVLQICGTPEHGKNYLLFNGDFVDRGSQSVEVILVLLAMAVANPWVMLLNRGNHESPSMNRVYGFEEEVMEKYSREVFDGFQEAFCRLPLATVVNGSVLVLHGGLFGRDGVKLRDLSNIDRKHREFRDFRGALAMDLLWSDPGPENGRRPSPRGAGVLFGPDVAERFCRENDLQFCIRSHQVVHQGYEWQAGNRCLTVFSAANYCGRHGNLGAVCHLEPREEDPKRLEIAFSTFAGAGRRSRL